MALPVAIAYCAANAPSCAAIGAVLAKGAKVAAAVTAGALTGVLLSKKIEDAAEPYPETLEVGGVTESCAGEPPPPKKDCMTAKKLLKKYKKLSGKYGKKPPEKTIEQLDRLRASGDITSNDLPGGLKSEFPGTLQGKTLKEIISICGKSRK